MVESEHVASVPVVCVPAFLQKPLTQSSSSAHSSSFLHGLALVHAPAWHAPPGQSASTAHGLHLPASQTWPFVQSLSLVHAGASTHALALHFLPLGHCASVLHSTHWLLLQTLPSLQ